MKTYNNQTQQMELLSVKESDQKKHVPGTAAVKTGTANVGDSGSWGQIPFILNDITIPLINFQGANPKNATTVAAALQTDINALFTGTANPANGSSVQTFTVTADGSGTRLVITAPFITGVPEVALSGSNATLLQFLGLTANTNVGTAGSN